MNKYLRKVFNHFLIAPARKVSNAHDTIALLQRRSSRLQTPAYRSASCPSHTIYGCFDIVFWGATTVKEAFLCQTTIKLMKLRNVVLTLFNQLLMNSTGNKQEGL